MFIKRDTIFIGHATPEDNEFTLWLQSKLQNEGYNCECDLSLLIGGESDYWNVLQEFLEKRTIKYILVISNSTFEKSGVLDEWEHCKSIEKQFGLKDFIIPVKIDNSAFNARIGLNRKNLIPFDKGWPSGLKRVFRKLINDQVPTVNNNSLSIKNWYNNVYTNWVGIQQNSSDTFYSNWLKIPRLPETLYFHKFSNDKQAKTIVKNTLFP